MGSYWRADLLSWQGVNTQSLSSDVYLCLPFFDGDLVIVIVKLPMCFSSNMWCCCSTFSQLLLLDAWIYTKWLVSTSTGKKKKWSIAFCKSNTVFRHILSCFMDSVFFFKYIYLFTTYRREGGKYITMNSAIHMVVPYGLDHWITHPSQVLGAYMVVSCFGVFSFLVVSWENLTLILPLGPFSLSIYWP